MTFAELVIQARYRLFDSRTNSGTVITSASSDGSRYTSNVLVNLSKRAVTEFYRLVALFDVPYLNKSMLIRKGSSTIASTGILSSTIEPDVIIRIVEDNDSEAIYNEVTPKEFLNLSNRNTTTDRKVFTRYYDATNEKVVTEVSPHPSSTLNVTLYYVESIETFLDISSSKELPFKNVDDLLLDYIEREARRIENNISQVNKLDGIIINKIREIGIELLGNKRQSN